MDIMESLNSDNVEDAQAALHEWFVDQGKAVQSRLSGQAVDEETINESSDTLVLLRDPNDGYDEVWAFQSKDDAQKFIERNRNYYEGSRYDMVAGDLARIITPEEMGKFSPPQHAAPAGIMDEVGSNDYDDEDEYGDEYGAEDDYDEAFDQWLNANRDKYAVETPDLSWGSNEDDEDDVEEAIDEAAGQGGFYVWNEVSNAAQTFTGPFESEEEAQANAAQVNGKVLPASELTPDEQKVLAQYESYQWKDANGTIEVDLGDQEELADVCKLIGIDGVPTGPTDDMDDEAIDAAQDAVDEWQDNGGYEATINAVQAKLPHMRLGAVDDADRATSAVSEADIIAELNEAFAGLEKVSDKLQNVEGAAVGEDGKLPVNTKDTVPHHKAKDRQGGEPVEIKSDDHKGFDLEKSPTVKDAPVKHHVQNSKDDPKKVGKEKAALLNKVDGTINTQSPISGKGAKGLKK